MPEPKDFNLTPPGLDPAILLQVEEMKNRIADLAARRKRRRPTLEAWSFRIETSLHHDLDRLAKHMKVVSMTDIVHGLLEIWVPVMLKGQGTAQAAGYGVPGIPAAQREQLAALLGSLVQVLQSSGGQS